MPRAVKILVILVAVLGVISTILAGFFAYNLVTRVQMESNLGYPVEITNVPVLKYWLYRLGYVGRVNIRPFRETSTYSISSIKVIFSDEVQPTYHVLSGDSIASSAGFKYNPANNKWR